MDRDIWMVGGCVLWFSARSTLPTMDDPTGQGFPALDGCCCAGRQLRNAERMTCWFLKARVFKTY